MTATMVVLQKAINRRYTPPPPTVDRGCGESLSLYVVDLALWWVSSAANVSDELYVICSRSITIDHCLFSMHSYDKLASLPYQFNL